MDNILIEKHFNKNIKDYVFYHCVLCKEHSLDLANEIHEYTVLGDVCHSGSKKTIFHHV